MSQNQIKEEATTTHEPRQKQQQNKEDQGQQQQNRKYLPDCKQDFDPPQFQQLAFKSNWIVWEKFQKGSNYSENLCRIAAFNDVISFWQVWNHLPHSDLSNLFYNSTKSVQKAFKVDGVEKQIDSINVFKQGIKPQWEDKHNNGGTLFNWKILGLAEATKEWLKLVLLVVSGSELLSDVDKINGIRVVDKKKNIKIQVWCQIDKEKDSKKIDKFKKELEAQFKIKDMNCIKIK